VNKIEILKQAFAHLHQTENVLIENHKAVLYFPTISVTIYEEDVEDRAHHSFNVNKYSEERIGVLINDILLAA
jgi:ATP-dependent protease HslVU (ClpYQ) ATPase subunit